MTGRNGMSLKASYAQGCKQHTEAQLGAKCNQCFLESPQPPPFWGLANPVGHYAGL